MSYFESRTCNKPSDLILLDRSSYFTGDNLTQTLNIKTAGNGITVTYEVNMRGSLVDFNQRRTEDHVSIESNT